jgi:hypothetical protein
MGILNRDPAAYDYATAKKEADTIVTAVVVGFAATRALLGQPFSFDMQDSDKPDDKGEFARLVAKWDMLLDCVDHVLIGLRVLIGHNTYADNLTSDDIARAVQDGVNPTSGEVSNEGRMHTITGTPGGEQLSTRDRWRRPWMNLIENRDPEYWGFGAYTGVCDDPIRSDRWLNPLLQRPAPNSLANLTDLSHAEHIVLVPTVDRIVRMPTLAYKIDPGAFNQGQPNSNFGRYKPANVSTWRTAKGDDTLAYGEINKSNEQQPPIGLNVNNSFVLSQDDRNSKIIGYVHGMCQAIVESAKRGPWCVAHEHAIGDVTNKLASCFACTTFMYASGFPASSSHFGRAESWVPPVAPQNNAGVAALSNALAYRWHAQIFGYLTLGARLLQEYFKGDGNRHPHNAYAPLVDQLLAALAYNYGNGDAQALTANYDLNSIVTSGGNFYLDALTHHDQDYPRMLNVLGLAEIEPEDLLHYQALLYENVTKPRAVQLELARKFMRDTRIYHPDWITKEAKAAIKKRQDDDRKRRERDQKLREELAEAERLEAQRRQAAANVDQQEREQSERRQREEEERLRAFHKKND